MRAGGLPVVLFVAATAWGCGGGASTSTVARIVTPLAASGATAGTAAAGLRVLLRPESDAPAHVHVELAFTAEGAGPQDFAGVRVEPHDIVATDDVGSVPVVARGSALHLGRPPVGVVHLRYDVPAETTASVDPLATVVQEDRFRAAGERLLFLPTTPLSAGHPRGPVDVCLDIDGTALKAPRAASTIGVGLSETRNLRIEGLLHTSFVAGSLGSAVFDAEAHDEAAWLGYTAFDPRPASAEIAQIRTAIGEFFRSELPPFTTLFVSQARALGSFSTHARAGGVLVLLGPAQTWDAALRLSITEQIVHGWIGGEIRLAAANETEARANAWFTEGVARFVAMRFLARLGLLSPDEVRAIVTGEMAALTTSPHRGATATSLANDPSPSARAELTARGALAALRIHVLLRGKTEGKRSFDDLLLALAEKARTAGGALPLTTFRELLERELGAAELQTFTATVEDGRLLVIPPRALGPCFRDQTTNYIAFDLGFDETHTLAATPHVIRGLRLDGPAARAGVRPDDELVALDESSAGSSSTGGVVLTVRRDGKEQSITYAPDGARARGASWRRVSEVPSSRCGEVP